MVNSIIWCPVPEIDHLIHGSFGLQISPSPTFPLFQKEVKTLPR